MKNDLKIPMVCELQRNRLGSYKELKVFVNFNSIMIKYSFIVLYIEKREKRKKKYTNNKHLYMSFNYNLL